MVGYESLISAKCLNIRADNDFSRNELNVFKRYTPNKSYDPPSTGWLKSQRDSSCHVEMRNERLQLKYLKSFSIETR